MPWVGKVWTFGDRPSFLPDDTSVIEHTPHDSVASVVNFSVPIRNHFRLMVAASLLPELSKQYLLLADDYVLLNNLSLDQANTLRSLGDLSQVQNRGRGVWKESLWRTHGLLERFGYPCLNFETHTPVRLDKRWVLEAYRDFRDFVTEDRFYGMLGLTAVLNHALSRHGMPVTVLSDDGERCGFWGRVPASQEVREAAQGKLFLNYDDEAWGSGLLAFLQSEFPQPSRYERPDEQSRNGLRSVSPFCIHVTPPASY